LFDEPLTNLDLRFREFVLNELINQMTEDKIFIIASHEIKEFDSLLSDFVILKNGKLSILYNSENVRKTTNLSIEEFYKGKVL